MRLLLIVFCFLTMGMGQVPPKDPPPTTIPPAPCSVCQDKDTDKPTAHGINEHYAYQNNDGSMTYIVQDRDYIHCLTVGKSSKIVTKDEWDLTIKDHQYQPVP